MKILLFDKKKGVMKLRANNLDDLWHLSKIIEPGDLVSGKTTRKIKLGEKEEKSRSVKKVFYATIRSDKVDFEIDTLRIGGKIAVEKEDLPLGASHSLEVRAGTEIKIEKKWREFQIKRLRDAEKETFSPRALVCVLDDEQANLAILTGVGIKQISEIPLRLAKKRILEKGDKFEKIVSEILKLNEELKPDAIILASPLFWKDELRKIILEKNAGLSKKIKLEDVSTGDKRGLTELINRGAVERIIQNSRLQLEFKLVEQLMIEISRQGLVVYGLKEVSQAVEAGAVKVLLITDELIKRSREKEEYEEIEKLIDAVEASKGDVHIISSEHEAGSKLSGLGGIAALLRFKI